MILIGTSGIFDSEWVILEIEEFSKHGKEIVPISIEGSLAPENLPDNFSQFIPKDTLRVSETQEAIDEGRPSGQFRDEFYCTPAMESARQILGEREAAKSWRIAIAASLFCIIVICVSLRFNGLKNKAEAASRDATKAKVVAESSERAVRQFEDDLHRKISSWHVDGGFGLSQFGGLAEGGGEESLAACVGFGLCCLVVVDHSWRGWLFSKIASPGS